MYTLYFSPGSCSMAVHVLLNELEVPFELKQVKLHGEKSPELLAVNPAGQVPVLTLEDGYHVTEGGAILTFLCDTHQKFLPASGTPRAKALQALMFCNATLHPNYSPIFKYKGTELANSPVLDNFVNALHLKWERIEDHLSQEKYMAGAEMSVADILLTVIANWNPAIGNLVTFGPNTKRLIQEISQRPAFQKALASEQVEYKAAA